MSVFGDWVAAAVRSRRGAAPQHRASGHEAYCISHGSVLILSVLLLPQSSFAADKRGDQRAQTPAIREHPGGLIQSQWLERGAVKDDAGKELGKIEEVGLDPKDGRVKEVVVPGGFPGIGERHRTLPWQDDCSDRGQS